MAKETSGRQYSAGKREAAVLRATEIGPGAAGRELGIPAGTIACWQTKERRRKPAASGTKETVEATEGHNERLTVASEAADSLSTVAVEQGAAADGEKAGRVVSGQGSGAPGGTSGSEASARKSLSVRGSTEVASPVTKGRILVGRRLLGSTPRPSGPASWSTPPSKAPPPLRRSSARRDSPSMSGAGAPGCMPRERRRRAL